MSALPCSHRLRTNPKEFSGAMIVNGLDLNTLMKEYYYSPSLL
jgi:hypothetical protein